MTRLGRDDHIDPTFTDKQGMESIDYTQVALAFGGLLILLGLFYYGARALSGSTRFGKWRPGQRLGLVDSTPLDGTRRLVLVRRDDTEHLLLLGSHGDLVIESGIPAAKPTAETATVPGAAPAGESGGWPSLRVPGRDRHA